MAEIKLNPLQLEIIKGITRKDKVIAARCGWGSGKTSALLSSPFYILLRLDRAHLLCWSLIQLQDTTLS